MNKRIIKILIIAIVALAADQASKFWAKDSLKGKVRIDIVDNYFAFEYHENPGSAFGLFRKTPGARYFLTGIGVVVLFFLWRIVNQAQKRRALADFAGALITGGAIGNLIDRIYIGRVVDFILMHWQHQYRWPTYNVADVSLVVGIGLLIIVLGSQPSPAKGKRA